MLFLLSLRRQQVIRRSSAHAEQLCATSLAQVEIPEVDTLVVGAGNSGAEIALELAGRWPDKRIWLAGRDPGYLPLLNDPVSWWVFSHVLSVSTPLDAPYGQINVHTGHPWGASNLLI